MKPAAKKFVRLPKAAVDVAVKAAADLQSLRAEKCALQKELDRLGEWLAENRPTSTRPGESHVDVAIRLLDEGTYLLDRNIDDAVARAGGLVSVLVARRAVKNYLDSEMAGRRGGESDAERRRRLAPEEPTEPRTITVRKGTTINRFGEPGPADAPTKHPKKAKR